MLYISTMTRSEAIQILISHQNELNKMGIKSLALFGSVGRDEAAPASDVDILIEFSRPIGYFHLFDVQEYLQKLLKVPKVDLVVRDSVIEDLKEAIFAEAVDVI